MKLRALFLVRFSGVVMQLIKPKKISIPLLLGMLLLVAGVSVGVFLMRSSTSFLPRATPEFAPKNLTVTNITENSFTISWVSEQKGVGYIQYGEGAATLDETATDDRDSLTGSRGSFATHHVTVRSLSPEKAYFFKVASGGNGQFYDNNGQPYQVPTAPVLGTPPPADTAYGEILTSAATPAVGSLVYIGLPDGNRLSTLVREGGQWALSLSTARSTSLQTYLSYDPATTIYDVLVVGDATSQSRVVTTTGGDQPLPSITLGQDYDFSSQTTSVEPGSASESALLTETATESATPRTTSGFSLEPLGEVAEATEELTILNPAIEKEGVNTDQPEFHGTAPAGTVLTIEVHSETPISDTVTVADNNTWAWTPPTNLAVGDHTVTVSFTDEKGILQTMTRSFTVFAADTNDEPSFVSTPSATPKVTPKPTSTPPPRVSQPASGSGGPKSGNTSTTFSLLFSGLLLVLFGSVIARSHNLSAKDA